MHGCVIDQHAPAPRPPSHPSFFLHPALQYYSASLPAPRPAILQRQPACTPPCNTTVPACLNPVHRPAGHEAFYQYCYCYVNWPQSASRVTDQLPPPPSPPLQVLHYQYPEEQPAAAAAAASTQPQPSTYTVGGPDKQQQLVSLPASLPGTRLSGDEVSRYVQVRQARGRGFSHLPVVQLSWPLWGGPSG